MRILLRDLTPGTPYVVQLRSNSGDDVSRWSRKFPLVTIEDTAPPDTPTWAGTPITIKGTAFLIDWNGINKTLENNRDFSHYELEFSATGGNTFYVTTQDTEYTLTFEENKSKFGTPKGEIFVKVRSVDESSNVSAWSTSETGQNPVPTAVSNVVATKGQDQLHVSWDASPDDDIIAYRVYIGTSAGFTPSLANRIFVGDALAFTYTTATYSEHFFKITAVDVFNQESTAVVSNGVTPDSPFVVDTTAPATPTSLSATLTNNANGIGANASVTWNQAAPAENDLAGFYIRYRKVGESNWSQKAVVASGALVSGTSYAATVEYLTAFTNYEFQIKSFDWTYNESAWTATHTATSPSNAVPANVTGLTSTPGKDSIIYSWNAVADQDIKNYEVTFSTSATFASGNITYLTGTATTLTVSGLNTGTTYYARVRAVDTAGQTSAAWSATDTETTGSYPANPTDGNPPSSSPTPTVAARRGYLYVTWSAVSNADPVTYEVHLSTSSGFTPSGATKVTEVEGTFAVVDVLPGTTTALTYGTTYYIKLIAKDADGSAAASTQASGAPVKVVSADITSVNADLIVAGSGILETLILQTNGKIQSANYSANTAGYRLDNTGLEINNGAVKASALRAATLTSDTGVIQIGAGASVVMNGGYLKSNTYTGTTQASNPSGAGFYLGNDGLRIDQGIVKAEAFSGGTFTAGTITIGAGGAITGGSWSLSNTGLSIPDGGVTASKIEVRSGVNIVPASYADFEDTTYTGKVVATNLIPDKNTNAKFNSQSLGTIWSAAPGNTFLYLGTSTTDYNIPIEAGQQYIFSVYAWCAGSVSTNFMLKVKWSDGTTTALNGTGVTLTNGGSPATATRISGTATAPAGTTGALVYVESSTLTANAGYNIDGLQVEHRYGGSTTPTPWKAPGTTKIDGAYIRTGEIRSTALAVDENGNTIAGEPAWVIKTTGDAIFGNTKVRGSLVVGQTGETYTSVVQSHNFVPGAVGWQISSDGNADFRGVQAEMINGQAIVVGSLSPLSWDDGEMNSVIKLNGTLQAEGTMGERVRLGAHGFDVIGPNEAIVTTASLTSNVVTLTTQTNHGYKSGSTIEVTGVSDVMNGSYTIASVPALNQLTYSKTNANISSFSPVGGIVYGVDTENPAADRQPQPVYVEFPSTIAKPNIISGTLQANVLSVATGATFRGTVGIESGSTFTIASKILAPKTAPSVNHTYNPIALNGVPGDTIQGAVIGHNGNLFVTSYAYWHPYYHAWVSEHTPNGDHVANRVYIPQFHTAGTIEFHGITYHNNNYYVLQYSGQGNLIGHRIRRYNTSWSEQQNLSVSTTIGDGISKAAIGWNFTNNRLLMAYDDGAFKIREYNINATTGAIETLNTTTTISAVNNDIGSPVFVARGTFGYAAGDRYIFKNRFTNTDNSNKENYVVTNTSGTIQTYEQWPAGDGENVSAAWWNTTASEFYDISSARFVRQYAAGDSFWSTATSETKRWVGYSYYKSTATTQETELSPRISYNLPKRARLSVTINPIPGGSASDLPNWARVYVARQDNDPGATGTVWKLRVTGSNPGSIQYPATTFKVNPTETPGSTQPQATNQFTAGGVGVIQSTSGNSFWKGDDTAQFYRLTISGDAEANTSGGNKPPLTIKEDGQNKNLRIDADEVIFMATDSTRGRGYFRSDDLKFDVTNGALVLWSNGNQLGAIRTDAGVSGSQISFQGNKLVVGTESYAGGTPGSGNTQSLYCLDLRSQANGVFMEDLAGGGSTGANINNSGRIIRSSTINMKESIEEMTAAEAYSVLGLKSYTYEFKESDGIKDPRRYPGFIAEQAAEAGAELWVGRQHKPIRDEDGNLIGFERDKNGPIQSFRTEAITVAHNVLIKDLFAKNEALEAENQSLHARLAAIEAHLGLT